MFRVVFLVVSLALLLGASTPDVVVTTDNNATLRNIPTIAANLVQRLGVVTKGDAPPLLFRPGTAACPLNAGNGDGGSQVRSADGKCWLAQFPVGPVDPSQWGALMTGLANDLPALNAAAAYLAAVGGGGGEIQIPNGRTSCINATLTLPPKVFLVGAGRESSSLCALATNLNPMVDIGDRGGIKGLTVNAAQAGVNTSGIAVRMGTASTNNNALIQEAYIKGGCLGVDTTGQNHQIDKTFIFDMTGAGCLGARVGHGSTGGTSTGLRLTDSIIACNSTTTGDVGLQLEDMGGLFQTNTDIVTCTNGTVIKPGANQIVAFTFITNTTSGDTTKTSSTLIDTAAATAKVYGINFDGGWSSSANPGSGMIVQNTGGGVIEGIHIVNHRFYLNFNNSFWIKTPAAGTIKDITVDNSTLCGLQNGTNILLGVGVSTVAVRNNKIGTDCDGQTPGVVNPTFGVGLSGSNADIIITGNDFAGFTVPGNAAISGIPIGNSIVANNTPIQGGGTIALLSTLNLNQVFPVWHIAGTGTTVTNITGGWTNRVVQLITDDGAVTFSGGNIANPITSAGAKATVTAFYDGALWYLTGNAPAGGGGGATVACSGTDDTAALQSAAASAGTGTTGAIALPVGQTCNFNQPIQFSNTHAPGFVCPTAYTCGLNWSGAATATPIVFSSNTGPFGASDIVRLVGGTGYAANDTVTLNDGCSTHAVVTIATVAAGVPATARITNMGSCSAKPAFNVAQLSSSGAGTGITFDMFYGSLGTRINYPTLQGIIFTSSTTMSEGPFIRYDLTGFLSHASNRLYGDNKMYQGVAVSRSSPWASLFDGSIENTIAESVTVSGSDLTTNHNVGTHFRNIALLGCNSGVASKAVAKTKGCLLIGDYVGGLFVDDQMQVYGHKGYGIYFGATLNHGGGNGLSGLANINGLNVEAQAPYSGSIGGGNWAELNIGGPAAWLTGYNLDTLDFSSGTVSFVRLDAEVFSSQNDASNPAALNFNGSLLNVNGSTIGGLTTGTTGVRLGTGAANAYFGNSMFTNLTTGIAGTTATGGIKTLSNVNFFNNGTDLSGLACKDFTIAGGTASAGGALCPSSKLLTFTRDLTAASGTVALTGFGFKPSRCSSFGAVDLTTTNYVTFNGKADATGTVSSLFFYTAGQILQSNVFLYAGDAGNNQQAVVSSFDVDGLTENWTKNGTPSGIFKYTVMCERG